MAKPIDCLFCSDGDPCPTHAVKVKAKASPKKKVLAPKPSAATTTPVAAPVAPEVKTSPWEEEPRRTRFDNKAPVQHAITEDERLTREAIRNLWPLLSASEKRKYEHIVNPPKTPAELRNKTEVRRRLNENVPRPTQD